MKTEDKLDESSVLIDEHQLDKECRKQASLYLQAAVLAAEKRQISDEAKNTLEVAEAELQLRIRKNPEKYNLEKPTEAAVNAVILQHKRYQEAHKAYLDAKHAENLANALVQALDQKKRALTLMVNLHSTSYFAEPRPNEGGREVAREMVKQRTSRPVERHRKEIDKEDNDED